MEVVESKEGLLPNCWLPESGNWLVPGPQLVLAGAYCDCEDCWLLALLALE